MESEYICSLFLNLSEGVIHFLIHKGKRYRQM